MSTQDQMEQFIGPVGIINDPSLSGIFARKITMTITKISDPDFHKDPLDNLDTSFGAMIKAALVEYAEQIEGDPRASPETVEDFTASNGLRIRVALNVVSKAERMLVETEDYSDEELSVCTDAERAALSGDVE